MKRLFYLIVATMLCGCVSTTNKPQTEQTQVLEKNADCKKTDANISKCGGSELSEAFARPSDNTDKAYVEEVENQAKAFFDKYPEYINSKEKEKILYTKFLNALNDKKYQRLNLYQTLLVAHMQLQTD